MYNHQKYSYQNIILRNIVSSYLLWYENGNDYEDLDEPIVCFWPRTRSWNPWKNPAEMWRIRMPTWTDSPRGASTTDKEKISQMSVKE